MSESMHDDRQGESGSPFTRLEDCLYQHRNGWIYARVRVGRRPTWRATKTTELSKARKWLTRWRNEQWAINTGIESREIRLHRERITVSKLLDEYVKAGYPTRKMHQKSARTMEYELRFMCPLRAYFGKMAAASLTMADCDKYLAWRQSGGYVSKSKGHEKVKGKWKRNRAVDLELNVLNNAIRLAVRRGTLKFNPIAGRARYTSADEVRHCREVAPTPEGLQKIIDRLREQKEETIADAVAFLAYTGLRVGEALPLKWDAVNLGEGIINVKREKRGINPWVPILPELDALLRAMKKRVTNVLLFPSPLKPSQHREESAVRRRIKAACEHLKLGHVTPHGLRSYFVTQARQSGLTDAEIAMLIGDKTGPALIAHTYGDVRPDHLLAQAQRIRLSVGPAAQSVSQPVSTDAPESSAVTPDDTKCSEVLQHTDAE